ncbi:MAG: hypothetical protein ACXQS8_08245 [Candidatus Helarchaeales archaeon]
MKKKVFWGIFIASIIISVISLIFFILGFPFLFIGIFIPPIIFYGLSGNDKTEYKQKRCQNCGFLLDPSFEFCPICGEKIPKEDF